MIWLVLATNIYEGTKPHLHQPGMVPTINYIFTRNNALRACTHDVVGGAVENASCCFFLWCSAIINLLLGGTVTVTSGLV